MLRVFIVDDEAPARKRLRKLLKPLAEEERLEVVGEAGDGQSALERLDRAAVDLLFLDIQMPELDGFGVLERLDPKDRPVVVFITAYDEYAVRAFEANAVDYLLKPIDRDRLREAVARAERLHRPEQRVLNDERLVRLLDWLDAQNGAPPQPATEFIRQISVPYRDRILIIPVEHLVTAEINEGITRLFVEVEDGPAPKPHVRQHVVSYTLDQLEANLDPEVFMRVHRSAIVRLDHIKEMIPWFSGRYKLMMTGGHEVIASRERSKLLKDRMLL